MQAHIINQLVEINRHFYRRHAVSFASTRRRVQPGVRKAMEKIPRDGCWLDLGCGTGTLALEMRHQGFRGLYIGLDSSNELLEDAVRINGGLDQSEFIAAFTRGDLLVPAWDKEPRAIAAGINSSGESCFRTILAFAVLHHLPGRELRRRVLQEIRALLQEGGLLVHSNWQFQNSARLARRIQPWHLAGISEDEVETGDALLDWRGASPGSAEPETGLRYVHLFGRLELAELAQGTGFKQIEEYESDGQGGRLGLYQIWQAN